MKKTLITALSCFIICTALSGAAFAEELIVGGQVVGIQISTKGVLVAGVAEVETAEGCKTPAADAGLKEGDLIIRINDEEVTRAGALVEKVGQQQGEAVELTVLRDDKTIKFTVKPALSCEEQWMMGMWLRDGISGIGTVTFCDPLTGLFGALGHSINDSGTGLTVPLESGHITEAEVVGVKKGSSGNPGELNGCADIGKILGSVEQNTGHGIYGQAYSNMGGRVMETGDICTGKASIISTINGRSAEEYQVEITRIYDDNDGRHVMLTVTDPELCSRTGGIVQGMSGSPIIQNGKLVGAVTHVFVNDPTKGYGISIYDMLDEACIKETAA